MSSSLVSGNAVVFSTNTGATTVETVVTWSVGSGTNRAVVVLLSYEQQATARTASTLTVGGVTFTKIVGQQYGTNPSYANAEIWACNEASATSIATNPTISVTWASPSGTPANNWMAQGVIVTAQDCDQNLSNWTFNDTDAQLANTTMTCTLTGFTTGSLVLGTYCDQTGASSINCQQTGGDAVTEFTGSDVNFNSSNARAVQFYATSDASPTYVVQRTTSSGSVYCALTVVGVPDAVADVTPPTVTGATLGTNGTTVTISFDETVAVGAGGNSGFVLTPSGGAATLSYASGSGSSSLVYTASRTINAGETITLAYTQPGNGIEDAAGNDLVTFTGQSVTNNSTQGSGPTITGTDPDAPLHLGSFTIEGSALPIAQAGLVSVQFVGAIQTVDLTPAFNSGTALGATMDIGNNRFGVAGNIVVNNSAGTDSNSYSVTPVPRSGGKYINITETLASNIDRLEAVPDIAIGHQIEAYGVAGGDIDDLTLYPDGSVAFAAAVTGFWARAHNGSVWGQPAWQSTQAAAINGQYRRFSICFSVRG